MRFGILAVSCITILVNIVFAKERNEGLLSGLLIKSPGSAATDTVIERERDDGNDDQDEDDCPRKYPLTPRNAQQVPYSFKRYGLVPDLLDDPPNGYLEVEYDDLKRCQPNLGSELDVCGIIEPPSRLKWRCKPDKFYTILLIDVNPYGSTRPKLLSQGILWWVTDIPGCNIADGNKLFEYQTPLPVYAAGKSRYTILAYEQPDYQIDWTEEPLVSATSEKHRYYKCLDKLVNKYELKLIAGNFFITKFNPCLEPILDSLDVPEPQYVLMAGEAADLPQDPFVTAGRIYQNALDKSLTLADIIQADDSGESSNTHANEADQSQFHAPSAH